MLNNFNVNRLVFNTADFAVNQYFYANSDDANGRILEVQLTNNGVVQNSVGYAIDLGFRTTKGTTGLVSFAVVDLNQGLYKIEYPTSMMIPGEVKCELRILYLTKLLVTKSFIVNVIDSVIDESTIEATNDFSALTTALGTVNNLVVRVSTLESTIVDKADKVDLGDKTTLNTTIKTNVVSAVNEVNTALSNKIKQFTYIASGTVTNVVHSLGYNSTHDDLLCFYGGGLMTEGIAQNYTNNVNGSSIDLVGWSLTSGEVIFFKLYKNVK